MPERPSVNVVIGMRQQALKRIELPCIEFRQFHRGEAAEQQISFLEAAAACLVEEPPAADVFRLGHVSSIRRRAV